MFHYEDEMLTVFENAIKNKSNELRLISGKIDALSPLAVLSRGYSITEKEGNVVFGIKQVSVGDQVSIRFKDGVANATVNSKKLSRKEKKR